MDLRRYERKFVVEGMGVDAVASRVRLHPAIFSEIYHERMVNSLYFDTPDFREFGENRDGHLRRKKTRLRWYGETWGDLEDVHLEEKAREGLLVSKRRHELRRLPMREDPDPAALLDILRDAPLPDRLRLEVASLRPTLIVRYRRRYFLSADRRFRATLDTAVSFRGIGRGRLAAWRTSIGLDPTILELKYAVEDDPDAARITTVWPFRLSRSSKYATGIVKVYF